MPPDQDCSDWLIGQLQNSLMTFDDNTNSLLQGQQKAFELCCALLRENMERVGKSRSNRSIRLRARELLQEIFRSSGPELFLLCTLGPTITKLGENALRIRLSKIQIWWKSIPRVQGLATVAKELCEINAIASLSLPSKKRQFLEGPGAMEHNSSERSERRSLAVPATECALQTEPDEQSQNIQAHGSGVGLQQEVTETPSNHSDQLVLENASLQGIAKVFDKSMCDAIRRVTVDGESKAAITTVFPSWVGPVDCLMSLDICEWDIARLAMALFNAEVKWVGRSLHVVLENGMTVTAETSEVILKGAEDNTINKVFGPEIHDAINACLIRKRETRQATECVSMIFTKNGAFINLSLGIRESLQIQSKLST